MNFISSPTTGASGTNLKAYLKASYQDIVEIFGQPLDKPSDKSAFEWAIIDENEQVYTIYDYHMDSEYPLPQFAKYANEYQWHIGCKSSLDALDLVSWIEEKINANKKQKN